MKTIAATEANRRFSAILKAVRAGETVTVTSHGQPVATIAPPDRRLAELEEARRRLFARLDSQPARNLGRMTRDEIYDADAE
jgi:prevent-host-death family protein